VLGLDIGGSSSRASLSRDGAVVGEASGPGANVATLGPRVIQSRLSSLLATLGPAQPEACCAGSAGAEVPAGKARLERLLKKTYPAARITVVHDTRLVLAAAGLEAGIVLIAGTGAVAYGRTVDGREARAGGWGPLLGDEGSATWCVREAAREVMRRADAGESPGVLGEALFAAVGVRSPQEMTGKLHRMKDASEWAAKADVVFSAAAIDAGAQAVIAGAAEALRGWVEVIRNRLAISGPVVLAGGLLLNQPRLTQAVRQRVENAVPLEAAPVVGAVRLAEASLKP
jgi:glucosamine kinase